MSDRRAPHPECLRTALHEAGVAPGEFAARTAVIEEAVQAGKCPRCGQQFGFLRPAASRSTPDACIPVCSSCGREEAIVQFESGGVAESLAAWPLYDQATPASGQGADEGTLTEQIVRLAMDFYSLDERIDWADLFDRAERVLGIDLPEQLDDPLLVTIKREVNRARREARED